jgi:FkbM family methyltransferase
MSLQQSVGSGFLRPLRKAGLAAAKRWPWPVEATIASGRRMYVDLRSPLGRGIFMKGEFDPNVFQPLRQVLRAGDTFLDVGANVGYYGMLALDVVGPSGAVHAFEIDERPLRCLRKTRNAQHLPNFFIHATAIGERTGTANFTEERDSGHSHLTPDPTARKVEMISLDDWWDRMGRPKVTAIKMDIEGAELAALKGARKLLTSQVPAIVCEAWDNPDAALSEAASFLRQLGYAVEAIANVHSPAFFGYGAQTGS